MFQWRSGLIRMDNGLNLIDGLEAHERVGGVPRFFGRAWCRMKHQMGEIKADLEMSAPDLPIGVVT
jgi:hypothetical protein